MIPFWALALVAGTAMVAVLLMLAARQFSPQGLLHDSVPAAAVFGVLGVAFAVLLAFVMFLGFESYVRAHEGASREAVAVSQLARVSRLFPVAQGEELRDDLGLPGMLILHFAWSDPTNKYLPHNYDKHYIVYTGTHDNDTTIGWFATASPDERFYMRTYMGTKGDDIAWDLIRLAFTSRANTAIVPLQDVLSLGTSARMNLPGHAGGNWGWRYRERMLSEELAQRLRRLTFATGRMLALTPSLRKSS